MELIKKRVTTIKKDTEFSEERIVEFRSSLRVSKRNLENALKEKEALTQRIEAVEGQIINADKQRQLILEQMKDLERNTTASEGKRKFLEDKELEGDQALLKLEERLSVARSRFDENSIKCEEAEARLKKLQEEQMNTSTRRKELEIKSRALQTDVDSKVLNIRDIEEMERRSWAKGTKDEDEIRLVECHYREMLERTEQGRVKVNRLQRMIEDVRGNYNVY